MLHNKQMSMDFLKLLILIGLINFGYSSSVQSLTLSSKYFESAQNLKLYDCNGNPYKSYLNQVNLSSINQENLRDTLVVLIPGAGSRGTKLYLGHIYWGEYFSIVTSFFEKKGINYKVLPSDLNGNNSVEDRVERLKDLIKNNKKDFSKFLLIGHSLGGIVAKLALLDQSLWDDLVAGITISTPHFGTPVVDWLYSGKKLPNFFLGLANIIGFKTEEKRYLRQLSVEFLNRSYQDENRDFKKPPLYSIGVWDYSKDLAKDNALLAFGQYVLKKITQDNELNSNNSDQNLTNYFTDGLVPLDSQIDERCFGIIKANHGSIIGKTIMSSKEFKKRLFNLYNSILISFFKTYNF